MPDEKLTNGNFSSGMSGWTVNNPTGSGQPFVNGDNSVSFNAGNERNFGDSIEQDFTAAPGSTQRVTMDLFENNGGNARHDFVVEIIDSNGTTVASHTYQVNNNSSISVDFSFEVTTETSTLRITNTHATNGGRNSDGKVDNVSITCFVRGTLIETDAGPMRVEDLRPGMMIRTIDDALRPLRLVLSSAVDPDMLGDEKLRPVRISAGAMGLGLPRQDLLVSRQHRMLVQSSITSDMFVGSQVLLSAIKLTAMPGIFVDYQVDEVEYFHLIFDQHEVIYANGAPSESFFPGPVALASLSKETREEFAALFPNWDGRNAFMEPALPIPDGRAQKALIKSHLLGNEALLGGYVSPSAVQF